MNMRDHICALADGTRSATEIANLAGCGKTKVRKVVSETGLSLKPYTAEKVWSPEMSARFAELWSAGHTVRQIAAVFSVTEGQANSHRKRLGLKPRQAGWPSADGLRPMPPTPTTPKCTDADAAFARAMAGRKFVSRDVSPEYVRLYSKSINVGLGASSMGWAG